MDKNEVRHLIKAHRQKLTDEDVKIQSRLIIDRLKKSDIYKTSENVFLYISYNREVDTYMLLSRCFMDGKKVYAPKVLSKTDMEFYCIQDEHDLVSGYMGIMEPSDSCEKANTRDGLFIMPGLAFDYDFHRIGYGGGFYDRYLSEDNTFIKAALAFDFQLLESIPYEEHDLKPDYIVTQTQFIRREN